MIPAVRRRIFGGFFFLFFLKKIDIEKLKNKILKKREILVEFDIIIFPNIS
jgi:hypothetical protein